jgi:hypothetical protein
MPDHVSWSQLETLSTCGERYRLRYLGEKVPQTPKGFFIGGNAVHASIEEAENSGLFMDPGAFERGGDVWLFFITDLNKRVLDAGGDEAVEWGGRKTKEFPEGEDRRWWEFNGPAMLRRYCLLRQEDEAEGLGKPETEVRVRMPREDAPGFLAYIDQLYPDRVRDYKTGKPSSAPPLQLALYEWMLRNLGHPERHIGEYVYLRPADAAGRVYQVDLDAWVGLVPTLVAQMDQTLQLGKFTFSPGMQCGWCDVAPSCEVGRRLKDSGHGLGGPQAPDQGQAVGTSV